MEGQGDLFEAGYLELKPHDTARIRRAVFQRLQPIADELKQENLSPLAIAEGFALMANEFRAEGQRRLTSDE